MKPGVQHASVRVLVPAGFSGWWCERCERAVTLSDELGSPARCPRCRKPTAVWVPPGRWERSNIEHRTSNIEHRTSNIEHLTAGRRADLVAHMHRVVEHPELPADLLEYERQQYELGEAL